MMREVPEDFARKLHDFNESQGGPARIEIAWDPKIERYVIFAVPQYHSRHPKAKNDHTAKLMRPFPDDSGRQGVLLFSWCSRDANGADTGYLPLDDRVFDALHWADTFRDRNHYDETFVKPEVQKEMELQNRLKVVAGAAREYWWRLDHPMVSMNPAIRARADWRAKQPWR